ncbi:MAG: thiamine phosphate synthase [Acutalibacteraceae bacterium]|nr:thiamine phosphate synthase [Acutalibacteraceae bacterium]
MSISKETMLLYGVTDRGNLHGKTLLLQVEESLKGGVTLVQLREKHLSFEEFLEEAKEMKELCHKYGVPLLINDNVEICIESGADGVHVGQKDMEAGAVREKLGKDKIIGVSARTVEQAMAAQNAGADYLGVGAVFSTSTKEDAKPLDHEILKAITKAVDIPVVAIGGISSENVSQLKGTGIDGVAVVSAIYGKENPKEAAENLKRLVSEVVKG